MKELFLEYKYPIIGGLIGLVLALFFFTIVFFKTILLLVMVGIGVFIGSYIKNEDLFGKFFQNK
ncbi:hypothetical protein Q9Q_01070 [Enterococcus faecalis EnGen0078]|uniref:DUF2273 domain-containing protein n=1 Tax=Enterococcus faecalis TaxID=1351 RepID=UPI00032E816A|nr:DUF2273 domain-containing protein [Enterococcus faecalis]EOE09580.1 hypothetical protein Q9Q_01070 [Enterococcus faecalis EnGen0078]EOK34613.1 hypothetical protein WU9_00470 [Enterococcus faecalis EnGen0334]UYY09500.1 DUF2273 domain-containing protein [Enterococcus faecalis]HBI2080739.1 DUF2273 domain-containing protein [Enterococcus faecalis]HCT3557435.1 DUF2273 domain-containing protein [Enterococcus faecalis]